MPSPAADLSHKQRDRLATAVFLHIPPTGLCADRRTRRTALGRLTALVNADLVVDGANVVRAASVPTFRQTRPSRLERTGDDSPGDHRHGGLVGC